MLEDGKKTIEGTILIIKEFYVIVKFGKKKKMIAFVNAKGFNTGAELQDTF